jgi:YaiO family outer membrane protein
LIFQTSFSQEQVDTYENPEEGFSAMRTAANAGEYANAKQIGLLLLAENPEYSDVSIYLARVYGWEKLYDSAYVLIEEVIAENPELPDAYIAYVDICYWENNWEKLKSVSDEALKVTNSDDIRAKYALALYHSGEDQQARSQADSVIVNEPEHLLANDVLQLLMLESDGPELFGFYSFDYFQKPYVRRWHMLTAGGVYPFSFGKLIPYINAGTQVNEESFSKSSDIQFNLESYFILSEKNYMLAGYGISPGKFFPSHTALLEVWQVLPAGFAISAGARYFYWDSHFLYWSLGLEKYLGSYWFALKNYIFFKDYGVSTSHYLTARKYLSSRNDFISLTLGYGTAPDEPVVVISDLDRLNAASVRVELSKQVHSSIRLNISAGYSYEEYMDRNYRNRFNVRLGAFFKLK